MWSWTCRTNSLAVVVMVVQLSTVAPSSSRQRRAIGSGPPRHRHQVGRWCRPRRQRPPTCEGESAGSPALRAGASARSPGQWRPGRSLAVTRRLSFSRSPGEVPLPPARPSPAAPRRDGGSSAAGRPGGADQRTEARSLGERTGGTQLHPVRGPPSRRGRRAGVRSRTTRGPERRSRVDRHVGVGRTIRGMTGPPLVPWPRHGCDGDGPAAASRG
jgi:hypothetical protein